MIHIIQTTQSYFELIFDAFPNMTCLCIDFTFVIRNIAIMIAHLLSPQLLRGWRPWQVFYWSQSPQKVETAFTATFSNRGKIGTLWSERCNRNMALITSHVSICIKRCVANAYTFTTHHMFIVMHCVDDVHFMTELSIHLLVQYLT